MGVIYEPTGPAREYAELACNLYLGCVHGCGYCYSPATQHTTKDAFNADPRPRATVLEQLGADLRRMNPTMKRMPPGSPRVLFSFLSDPYQPAEETERLTRRALALCHTHGVPSAVLTKAEDLPLRDLDLWRAADTHVGISLSWISDRAREEWEPFAGSVTGRLEVLRRAKAVGCRTWISLEPVIIPDEALGVIRLSRDIADEYRIGALTHHPAARNVDWRGFAHQIHDTLRSTGKAYLIKQSLAGFLPREAVTRRGVEVRPASTTSNRRGPGLAPRTSQAALDL